MKKILLALIYAEVLQNGINLKKQKTQLLKIMATLTEVQTALATLQASVDSKQAEIIAKIQELKDQIGGGGTVTEADLDGLLATVEGIKTDVETTDLG